MSQVLPPQLLTPEYNSCFLSFIHLRITPMANLKLQKLFKFLDILSNIAKKTLTDPSTSILFFRNLKKLHCLHFVCVSELSLILNLLGLEHIASFIEKLFHSFKLQVYSLLIFQQNSMRFKAFPNENLKSSKESDKSWFSSEMIHVIVQLLEKLDYRHRYYLSNEMNQFEKLEKARFFLEQELGTLEEMLKDYKNSKDEIEALLKTKGSFHGITHSGLQHFLQGFLTDTKKVAIGLSQFIEEEKKEDEKYAELFKIDFKFDDIKSGIMKSIGNEQKRFLKKIVTANRRSIIVNLCEQATQTQSNSESSGLALDNTDNLTLENIPSSAPALRRLVMSLNFEKKEISSKLLFANQKIESWQTKMQGLEKKIKTERENNTKLTETNSDLEFKLQRKRQKLKTLKLENKELVGKLEHYVDKDQMNRVMIMNKADDLERNVMKIEEKEQQHFIEISQKNDEIKELKNKIQELEETIRSIEELKGQLAELLVFEQEKNLDLVQKQQELLPQNNLDTPPSSNRNLRPSYMKSETENILRPKGRGTALFLKNNEDFSKLGAPPLKTMKTHKGSLFKSEIETPKVTLRPSEDEAQKVVVQNDINANLNTKLIITSEKKEKSTEQTNDKKEKNNKEIEKIIDSITRMKDDQKFERNLHFLIDNRELDIEKEEEKKKTMKQKITEYEKIIREQKEKSEKLNRKLEEYEKNARTGFEKNVHRSSETKEKISDFSDRIEKNNIKNERNLILLKKNTEKKERNSITPEKSQNFFEKQAEMLSKMIENQEKPTKTSILPRKTIEIKTKTGHLRVKTEESPFFEKINSEKTKAKFRKTSNFMKKPVKTPISKDQTPYFEDFDEKMFASMVFEPTTKERSVEEDDDNNFSKKKFLYKYPFKQIDAYLNVEKDKKEDEAEKNNNEEFFRKIFEELCRKHQNCGKNCDHLNRFYRKIPFIARFRQKSRLAEQKTIIDRLPIDF